MLSEAGELIAVVTILHDHSEVLERARLYEQVKRASDELEAKVVAATAELARQNELLRRQAMELEQASALKSQFLANMSHEFRTPLNAILGYTSILLEGVSGALTPGQRKSLERIGSNGRHLVGIVSEILDITRIEAGRMPLQISRFTLRELLDEVMAEMEPIIARSKLTVSSHVSPNLGPIRSDRQKIKQIVLNLLSNALKFTPKARSPFASRRPRLRKWWRSRLPTPASASIRRSRENLRGLPSGRQHRGEAVRRHRPRPVDLPPPGDHARRENRIGERGRTRLDVHVGRGGFSAKMTSDNLAPLVLVVDDYQDAREMYAEYLVFSGFRVAEASNGLEAVQQAFELTPDIILMDLSLPGMDGWEATRRIKMDERTKHIPVIALTGHALPGFSESARNAGCDGFVIKPCLPDAIVGEVRRLLETFKRKATAGGGTSHA